MNWLSNCRAKSLEKVGWFLMWRKIWRTKNFVPATEISKLILELIQAKNSITYKFAFDVEQEFTITFGTLILELRNTCIE